MMDILKIFGFGITGFLAMVLITLPIVFINAYSKTERVKEICQFIVDVLGYFVSGLGLTVIGATVLGLLGW